MTDSTKIVKNRKAEHEYQMGDLVAIKQTKFVAGRKMTAGYLGPYDVTKTKRNGRYEIY